MSNSLHIIKPTDPIGIDLKHQLTIPVHEGKKGDVVMYYSKHNDPIYLVLNKNGTLHSGKDGKLSKTKAMEIADRR